MMRSNRVRCVLTESHYEELLTILHLGELTLNPTNTLAVHSARMTSANISQTALPSCYRLILFINHLACGLEIEEGFTEQRVPHSCS
jgi:hypothetical protein